MPTTERSSTGLDANIAAALSYFFGLLSGAVFFAIETESRFVKFHAMQSMLASVAAIVLWIVYMVLATILVHIPVLGWIVLLLMWTALALGMLGLWLFCMFQSFQGHRFKLPIIGEVAEKQVWPSERPGAPSA